MVATFVREGMCNSSEKPYKLPSFWHHHVAVQIYPPKTQDLHSLKTPQKSQAILKNKGKYFKTVFQSNLFFA